MMIGLPRGDEMDAESLLDEFAERLGRRLADQGFETDEWKFRRYSEHRDALILAFQQAKLWSDDEAHFFINVYLSLNPVWEHERVADGLPEDEPPPVSSGIMVTRIEPPSPYEDSWRIVNEATSADVLEKVLQRMGEVLPHYVGLLDRTELPARLDELFGPSAPGVSEAGFSPRAGPPTSSSSCCPNRKTSTRLTARPPN